MKDPPETEVDFNIEEPDERGDVWVSSDEGRDGWRRNLGPADKVADKFISWLKNKWLRIGKAGAFRKPPTP